MPICMVTKNTVNFHALLALKDRIVCKRMLIMCTNMPRSKGGKIKHIQKVKARQKRVRVCDC